MIITECKNKETKTRGPYRKTRLAIHQMIKDKIWYVLPSPNLKNYKWISKKYNIKYGTVAYYRTMLKLNLDYLPVTEYGHAELQRVFSSEQEQNIWCFKKSIEIGT